MLEDEEHAVAEVGSVGADQPSVKKSLEGMCTGGEGRGGAKGQKTQLNTLTGKLSHTPPTMTEFLT